MRLGPGLLVLLVLLGACSSVDRDVKLASLWDDIKDVAYGGDRGLWNYRGTIRESTTSISGPYRYRNPAHVSQYRVDRAVHGLGGTETENAEELAQVVDTLFQVARHDPTPAVRSSAVSNLGRVLLRMPVDPADKLAPVKGAEDRINELALDLFGIKVRLDKGVKVKESEVLVLMDRLRQEHAPNMHSALQLVRAFVLPPIALTARGKVYDLREEMVPPMVRDSILVTLRELACGDPVTRRRPDPSPIVRGDAADVLARVRSAAALDAAIARLSDPIDPVEKDPIVRAKLVRYLGHVGGPEAFDACLARLGDLHQSVRYQAVAGLRRMTGAPLSDEASSWEAWRAQRPQWKPAPAKSDRAEE